MSQRTNKGYYNAGAHKKPLSAKGFRTLVLRKEPISDEIIDVRYKYYLICWKKMHLGIDPDAI